MLIYLYSLVQYTSKMAKGPDAGACEVLVNQHTQAQALQAPTSQNVPFAAHLRLWPASSLSKKDASILMPLPIRW
jgi:hypothetical protein